MSERVSEITPDEIRAIRMGLGLSQVDAGELLGGGPRAFTKYEAGTVRPAASVVNLLRLLEADPAALLTLGGSVPQAGRDADTLPLEVSRAHIEALTERTFPLLLLRLLSAEAQANGLPEYGIHVAGSITTPDGGEDGRITWTEGPDGTRFLPSRLCQFQLKAGRIGPADAARDVLTPRGEVKGMVRSALEADGCYIMVSADSCTQQMIEARRASIRAALRGAGMDIADDRIDFRDAGQVAAWANCYPSVAAWVKERTQPGTIGPFQSWRHWAGRAEHDAASWTDDERFSELRAHVLAAALEPRRFCRIVGRSGIGKSRLVLEALAPAHEAEASGYSLSDLVLYADESEVGSPAINGVAQVLAENGQRAVIVVDRCPPETHQFLAGMVMRSGSRLSLITIDHEMPRGSAERTLFRLDDAPSSVTEAIVRQVSPGLPSEDHRRLVRFSRGFPKIAMLVAQAWAESRPVAHATEDHFVEAFVLGRRPPDPDLLLKSAKLLATFGLVKVDHPDGDQLEEVAGRGRGLTAGDLRFAIQELIHRGAAERRGRTVIFPASPISMNLAERQWQEWGPGAWRDVLAGDDSSDLKVSAAKRLALLSPEIAQPVVESVCDVGGPFDGMGGISRVGHAAVVSALAQIDSQRVAQQIDRSLGDVEDLLTVEGDVRRDLVWALDKIAFHPEAFYDGARLLLRLALAENESWANNATGQFKELFPVILGNTAANGSTRFSFLQEAAQTDDPQQRMVVVDALIAGTWAGHSSRSVGAETHGSRPALESWRPATREELDAYVEGCVTLLANFAAGDDESGRAARTGLGRNLRGLLANGFIDLVEAVVRRIVAAAGSWHEALEGLGEFLRYEARRMDPVLVGRVRTLMDEVISQGLESRVRLLVSEMPWDYLRDEEQDMESCHDRQVEAVRELARELVEQPETLRGLLPQLCRGSQRMSCPFGHAIAEFSAAPLDSLEVIVAAIEEVPGDERNFDLLSGYLTRIVGDYPGDVEAFKQRAAQSFDLASGLPLICWRLGISISDIELVAGAFQANLLPPWPLMQWTLGGVLAQAPARAVGPLFDALLDHSPQAFGVALDLMGMYTHQSLEKLEDLRPQLRKIAENLTRWEHPRYRHPDGHHFGDLMKWILEQGRQDPDARSVALTLSRAFVDLDDDLRRRFIRPVARTLLEGFPEIAWPIIGNAIISDQLLAWSLGYILGGRLSSGDRHNSVILSLPEDVLFAWCHAHPDSAPSFTATVVPVLTTYDHEAADRAIHPLMARLLDEFGDRDDVLRCIGGNIHSYFGWGSPANYYALYENPLTRLSEEHPSLRVRRWARSTLRGLAASSEGARAEDEEWHARLES